MNPSRLNCNQKHELVNTHTGTHMHAHTNTQVDVETDIRYVYVHLYKDKYFLDRSMKKS